MPFDYDSAYQATRRYLGKKENNLDTALSQEKSADKKTSLLSEIFFAHILIKACGNKIKLIEQHGEHHPDISLKVANKRVNIEVTLITADDERFHKKVVDANDEITTDRPKLFITSQVLDKTRQYSRWIEKNIVSNDDVNIIAIDLGNLFPFTPAGPLLSAALNMFHDKLKLHICNNSSALLSLPESKNYLMKNEDNKINLNQVYDGLAPIDAIISFTKNSVLESNNELHIININNNKTVDLLFNHLSRYYQTTINRWLILR